MDVKVRIGGVEATVTVKDATEAAALLASIASNAPQSQPAAPSANPAHSPPRVPEQGERSGELQASKEPERIAVDETALRDALTSLTGTEAAKVLATIARHPHWCSDTELREIMHQQYGWVGKLGPIMSNVTKACKRGEIPLEHVLRRMQKRAGKGGKIAYYYKLTEPASRVVRSIPKFDQEPEFPEDPFAQ